MPRTREQIESDLTPLTARRQALAQRSAEVTRELGDAQRDRMKLLTDGDTAKTQALTDKIVRLESERAAIASATSTLDGQDAVLVRELAGVNADDAEKRYLAALTAAQASRAPLAKGLRTFVMETLPALREGIEEANAALGIAARAAKAADASAGRPETSRTSSVQLVEERLPLGLIIATNNLLEELENYRLSVVNADKAQPASTIPAPALSTAAAGAAQ